MFLIEKQCFLENIQKAPTVENVKKQKDSYKAKILSCFYSEKDLELDEYASLMEECIDKEIFNAPLHRINILYFKHSKRKERKRLL